MKSCPTSLIIKEMQIKSTVRYYCTPVRMVIIIKSAKKRVWRKRNAPTLLVGM